MTHPQAVHLPGDLDGRHVLAVPRGTDVAALAAAWFPDAAWLREPVTAAQAAAGARPMTGARFRGISAEAAEPAPGILRLDGSASLEGPTPLSRAAAQDAGLAPVDVDLYALAASRDAGGPAEIVLGWMSAAARRSAGCLVPADRARVVTPDAGAAVDLTLWSAVPLSAQDALPLVRPALAGARVGPTEVPQQQPAGDGPAAFSVTGTLE